MSEVNMIFYDLIDYLCLYLFAAEKTSFDLTEKCGDFNPPFSKQYFKNICECKSFNLFKMYVLPFITWLDHSILNELVVESGNKDALELLNLFDSKIDSYCNHPITSFPILSPSQLMIPLDDSKYTLLAMKFHPPTRSDTTHGMIILQDIMNIKLILKHKWEINSHDIQLVAIHAKLELLYWMISKCRVEAIEGNLVPDWKSGIIMMSVLPANFHSLQSNCETLINKGPFSSLNFLSQDDTEVDTYLANNHLFRHVQTAYKIIFYALSAYKSILFT